MAPETRRRVGTWWKPFARSLEQRPFLESAWDINFSEWLVAEKLITHFSRGPYEHEIQKAREEYESLVSPLRADEPSEGFIITCFHSWFLFDRKIRTSIKTPAEMVASGQEMSLSPEETYLLSMW